MTKLLLSLSLTVIVFMNTAFAQVCTINAGAISSTSTKTFCGGDGINDIVNVTVTGAVGDNYRILYADANDVIKIIQQGNSFNFEGLPSTTLNARGISYNNGLLGLAVGNKISNLSGCFALSTTGFTITVFNKEAGSVSSQGSVAVTVCVDDKVADIIPITYSGFDAFGSLWATTDLNGNILKLDFDVPNFEGTGQGVAYLRLITSCFETFEIPIGTNISQLPSHMDFSNAITVTKKTGCAPPVVCAPEVKACPGKVLMCVNGVSTCVASNQVNKFLKTGAKKGGCIVCTGGSGSTTLHKAPNKFSTVESQSDKLTVYPNPSKGSFKINSTVTGNVKYELRSATGQIVWTKSLYQFNRNTNTLSLQHLNLKPGIYYLQISNKNVIQTRSLVIAK